ncbi:putative type-B carboxylesterase lipase family protein [Lyophyllum shimeji]|uniref:Carboxylic ester hydrolase n=1 Tax=Lyophyllum shimeji TaxID=47721 RepID=A0A9P3UQ18_LYOSH|nr:putative type-B carboxylesterase lipase family protein [Lyophyllum shimeji]
MLTGLFSVLLPSLLLLPRNTNAGRTLTSPLGPVVDLGYAAYAGNTTSPTGVESGPVTFFGNIPYAQPPLWELRFRAPRMLNERAVTSHVDDARGWGPPCIQRPAVVGIGTEDCLKLNIWKPTNATEGDKLPVTVYIHGGGFYYNSPQGFPMNTWVAQHPGGVLGVSMAYRMSLFGFLGGSAVAADGDLNTGLLDQRAALEWIQRHIAKFGGDPDNVTIYGESAGGASVVMQLVAYGGSKPVPFKRVTAQSIGFGPTRTQDQIEAAFASAAAFAGCPTSGKEAMACLRSASVGALVSAVNRVPNGAFALVIEGLSGFLPDLPSRLVAAGKFSQVDFVGGHCTGDGKSFTAGKPQDVNTEDDLRKAVFSRWPGVSNATIAKALALYPAPGAPGSPFATQYDRASTMAGEIVFTCMDWFVAESLLAKGAKNVFSYTWNAPDPAIYATTPYRGAAHTSDIYYLFEGTNPFGNAGNTFTPFNTSEAALASEAIAYWTSFAATGDPSSMKKQASPTWDTFVSSENARRRLMLERGSDTATNSGMENVTAAEIERCRFWMSEEVTAETRI